MEIIIPGEHLVSKLKPKPKRKASELAKARRLEALLKRVRDGEALSARETRELEELEDELDTTPLEGEERWNLRSLEELAGWWGVSRKTIQDWIRHGAPRVQISAKRFRYDVREIAKWRHTRDVDLWREGGTTNESKRDYDQTRTALLRMKLAREQSDTIEVEKVVEDLRELYVATRTGLLAARSKFPPEYQAEYSNIVRESLSGIVADLRDRERQLEGKV